MRPWTSQAMRRSDARALARWWDGYHGYGARLERAYGRLYRVRVW